MAVPTVAEFRAQLPEFASTTDYPDVQVTAKIRLARLLHDIRKTAIIYLAAHLFAIEEENTGKADGGAGVVASEKIGPRQVAYLTQADGSARRAFYATSSYGRMFLALADTSARASVGARVA